jgi:GxxExxY protein
VSKSRRAAKTQKRWETMTENEIGTDIVDSAFKVHTKLGPGLLESVYEICLAHELKSRGLLVKRQHRVSIEYDGVKFEEGFRADLLVENKVIIELKSVERTIPAHKKQVLTYIKLADIKLGYLINFGEAYIKDGTTRIVNNLPE